jgi:hypothetical protein
MKIITDYWALLVAMVLAVLTAYVIRAIWIFIWKAQRAIFSSPPKAQRTVFPPWKEQYEKEEARLKERAEKETIV